MFRPPMHQPAQTRASKAASEEPLSLRELHQLTLYKWSYTLRSHGFKPWQIEELIFLKWMHKTGRLPG